MKEPIFGIRRLRMGIDGRGITTLVAFMGCPLQCRYCLNDYCHANILTADGGKLRDGIRLLTPLQLYNIVRQDNIYFQATGGGVCFGGGEPAAKADFISEFRKLCGSRWRITIETSLALPPERWQRLADVVDEWIVDVKDMNDEIYQRYTGVASHIYANLSVLLRMVGADRIKIRLPHIPNYNTDADVNNSKSLLKSMGFSNIDEFQYYKIWKKEKKNASY